MKLFSDEIRNISVDEIIPNKINPNNMSPPTFEKLCLSMKKFGQLNPIIIRKIKEGFEIIDGEWRWKACKKLGWREVQAKVIEATDEEVINLIFASTIKGKHDVYSASELIEELAETGTDKDLKAINLDKAKIERKIKYSKAKNVSLVKKKLKDEKDSSNVKPISNYKKLIPLIEAPKYCKIEDGKVVLK
jgi:ParB/RepB/Spo0J family partition protein